MIWGRRRVVDLFLGDCVVFGGSRILIAFFGAFGLGCLILGVTDTWRSMGPWLLGPIALLFAAWTMNQQLAIGERGFRYVGPFRKLEATWSNVDSIDVQRNGQVSVLVVGMSDGSRAGSRSVRIGLMFSAGSGEISDQMMARRLASLADRSGPAASPRPDAVDAR